MLKLFQASLQPDPSPGIIINSNADVWQRGTAARTHTTTYNTDTSYSVDRFFTLPAGASMTSQQSASVPDAKSTASVQLNGAASVTTVDHGQRIRSALASRYRTDLLFRAWIYNDSGAAFVPNLRVGTPGAVDNFATVTNRLDQALQSCADAAWTEVSYIFNPSAYTNIANGMEVAIRVPSGSLVAGDTVRISQFDLKAATRWKPYSAPDPDIEQYRSQYYYQRYGPGGGLVTVFATGYAFSTSLGLMFLPFRQLMRGTPTFAFSATGDFALSPGASGISTITFNGDRHGGRLDVTMTATPLTANQAYQLQTASTANAWLEVRAEL